MGLRWPPLRTAGTSGSAGAWTMAPAASGEIDDLGVPDLTGVLREEVGEGAEVAGCPRCRCVGEGGIEVCVLGPCRIHTQGSEREKHRRKKPHGNCSGSQPPRPPSVHGVRLLLVLLPCV